MRTGLFTIAVPGTVLVVVPMLLVRFGIGPRLEPDSMRYVGLAAILAGAAAIVWCFVAFVRRGRGTPAPYDPPRRLVAVGLYRYVRNPQYVGVLLVVVGEALLSGATTLFAYAMLLAIGYHLFVKYYEEPRLLRTFGDAYVRYVQAVPRWIPKMPPQDFQGG
jgi:protein-S-isoprenylcysteine O-methyltransferase Ste14